MTWDEWRGSLDGRATFWLKRLLHVGGFRLDLHKFIGADDPGCFHSHPAWAVRIVLRGGYVEEIYGDETRRSIKCWLPGDIGLIRPAFAHRIMGLVDGDSYSLWLRGPVVAKIKLLGWGWPENAEPHPTAGLK